MRKYIYCVIAILLPLFLLSCGKIVNTSFPDNNSSEDILMSQSISYDTDYPVIFVHGISHKYDVEDTWSDMLSKLNNVDGYVAYPETIYSGTKLEKNSLPANSLFKVGYYREKAGDIFGSPRGYIGGLSTDYYNEYHARYTLPNRVSYSSRLSKIVDQVLNATGASKVNIVGHSMGGIVSRAYIRWEGGHLKVNKLITVGSPNSGVPRDSRLFFIKKGIKDWQRLELSELEKSKAFNGRSYTDWLNDGWESFCKNNGIEYATIRGNYNPVNIPGPGIPWLNIGDGVIDEEDATIAGASFNGVVYAAHSSGLPDPISMSIPPERDLTKTTYTAEVIRNWLFQNKIKRGGRLHRYSSSIHFILYPSPFEKNFSIFYTIEGDALYVQATLRDFRGDSLKSYGFPAMNSYMKINSGEGTQLFIETPDDLPASTYFMEILAYDMDKLILSETIKITNCPGEKCLEETESMNSPKIVFLKTPDRKTLSPTADFEVGVEDGNLDVLYAYKLDDQQWDRYFRKSNNKVSFDNLSEGTHTIYFAAMYRDAMAVTTISYDWEVGKVNDIIIMDEVFNEDRSFKSSSSISAKNVKLSSGKLTLTARQAININANFDVQRGASFDVVIE